jgi:hypothetical protein
LKQEERRREKRERGLFDPTAAARRRVLVNAAVEAVCTALSIALAGTLVLLLLGTEILEWYWIPALFTTGPLSESPGPIARSPRLTACFRPWTAD